MTHIPESTSTLTECKLLERASRGLGKHKVDKSDLKGIPHTVTSVFQYVLIFASLR